MKFDVLFLDNICPKPYDTLRLEHEALGGSESSVIRVAEGLAALGLKIAVSQHNLDTAIMGQHCFYIPMADLTQHSTDHLVLVRGIEGIEYFPRAKKYVWLHDIVDTREKTWPGILKKHHAKILGVSQWHRGQILANLDYKNVDYVYNPVPEQIYLDINMRPQIDKNRMVWVSSPHKGLDNALETFSEIKKQAPEMVLTVFNPGYLKSTLKLIPGVQFYGSYPCKDLWNYVAQSLCVFFPTTYQETFCCVAAEANALGTPIATMPVAALNETVSSKDQLSGEIVERVLRWRVERPVVSGQERFKLSQVIKNWFMLLSS